MGDDLLHGLELSGGVDRAAPAIGGTAMEYSAKAMMRLVSPLIKDAPIKESEGNPLGGVPTITHLCAIWSAQRIDMHQGVPARMVQVPWVTSN